MDIKTGDEIRVLARTSYHGPVELIPGSVTKVGRKYATAAYETEPASRPFGMASGPIPRIIEFDLATGYAKGDEQGNGNRVLSMEMAAIRERREAAYATLHRAGITFNGNAGYNLEVGQLEALAAVAASFPEYERNR